MAAALALLASLLWGTSDFFGGLTSRRLPAFAVYCGSQVIAAAALVVAATVTGAWATDPAYLPWALLSGITGMAGMVLFYQAMAIGPMGIISPIVGLAVIVPVGVALVRGEQPTSLQMLGILLAVAGILLASGPELGERRSARPVLIAVASMACFGVAVVAQAEGSQTSPVMTTTTTRLLTVLVAVVAVLMTRSTGGLRVRDTGVLALIGLTDAGANLSFSVATTLGLLSTTAVLSSLYPVVTALLAAGLLHERLRTVQYVGVLCVMSGIVLVSAG